jgi:hypothetical protein
LSFRLGFDFGLGGSGFFDLAYLAGGFARRGASAAFAVSRRERGGVLGLRLCVVAIPSLERIYPSFGGFKTNDCGVLRQYESIHHVWLGARAKTDARLHFSAKNADFYKAL